MKNKSISLLTKNMLTNSFGTVLLKSLPLIVTPIISILLTPEEYGEVSLFLTWVSLIGVFIGLQANGSLQNALKNYDENKFNKYCSSILSLAFLSFIFLFILVIIFQQQIIKLLELTKLIIFLIIPTCFGSFCVSFFSSYFLSLKKAKENLILTFFTTLIIAITSLLCAKFYPVNYIGYILGYAIPYIIIGFTLFMIFIIKNRCFFKWEYWMFCLIFSIPLIFHAFSNTLLSQSDKLMIEYVNKDTSGLGVYNMMHTVSSVVNSLWGAMNAAFVPFYYDFLKENNISELKTRSINYSFIFTCIVSGFMLVSPEITTLLVDEKYLQGLNLLPMMIFSGYLVFLYSFSVNYEFYTGKTIWIAIGTICTAIIKIVLNYFLLELWGVLGICIASCISYFLLFIFHEIISRFIIKKYPMSYSFFIILFLIMFSLFILTYLFFDIWIIRWILFIMIVTLFFYRIIKTGTII